MQTLALTYRPRSFADLIGQPATQLFLRRMVELDCIPTALLFAGVRGTGKTTTARILAAALNCTDPARPCGTCPPCKETFDGSSPDVLEIDAASNGLVDDMRSLRQQVMYRQSGRKRVIILDEAQSISPQGFNVLLKTLEEPPPDTHFLLLTTEEGKILPTVASRCMPFRFDRLSVRDIANRLADVARTEGYACEDGLLLCIAEAADGAMRDALMKLQQCLTVGMTTAEQYQRVLGRPDLAPAILKRLVAHDLPGALDEASNALTRVASPGYITVDLSRCLVDVLKLRKGGELARTGTALADRQDLALALEPEIISAALNMFWRVPPVSERSQLELIIVKLSEIFAAVPQARNTTKVSLADMGRRS